MAITKTTAITAINVHYWSEIPTVVVESQTTYDDPDDDKLPLANSSSKHITKMTSTTTYDETTGEPSTTEAVTDISGEDPKVIAVCNAVWGD